MAIYDFTGANGDPLPTGLTAQTAPLSSPTYSQFQIQSNSLATLSGIPNASGAVFYETTGGLADDDISIDIILGSGSSGGSSGAAFRQTDGDNYLVAFINSSGLFRLFKNEAESFSQVGSTYTIPAFSVLTKYTIRVVFSGDTIDCYLDGTLRISATSSFNQSATKHGARLADNAVRVDNLTTTSGAAADSVSIEEAAFDNYIYQRNGSNEHTATFNVSFSGSPTALEYQLYDASDDSIIQAWTTFDGSPVGGSSTLNITRTSALTQYYVGVRFLNDTGINDTQTNVWGVGIKALLIGQSLAQHLYTQDAAAALTGYYYFSGSSFTQPTQGAGQRALAETLINEYSCLVALTNTAVGGTCLSEECAIARGDGSNYWENPSSTLYTSTLSRFSSFADDNRVEFVLWIQGQTDAVVNVSKVDYTTALTSFIAQARSDFLDKTGGSNVPIVAGTLGRNTSTGNNVGAQDVRESILDFIDADGNMSPLHIYTLATDDGTHPNDAGDIKLGQDVANLIIGNSAPAITGISLGTTNEIRLTFDSDLATATSYSTEGVRVVSNSINQPISSFDKTGVREAAVTLSSNITDASDVDVYLSWGTGTTSNLLSYPESNNSFALVSSPYYAVGLDLASSSTLNLTINNLPAGTYDVDFYNDTTKMLIETRNISFTDSTLDESLPVAASTPVFGKVDGDNMPTNGAPFYGVTV